MPGRLIMTDTKITLCLAHGHGNDMRCPKAYECKRHLALRARKFPDEATIIGTACASRDYQLFVPAGEVKA